MVLFLGGTKAWNFNCLLYLFWKIMACNCCGTFPECFYYLIYSCYFSGSPCFSPISWLLRCSRPFNGRKRQCIHCEFARTRDRCFLGWFGLWFLLSIWSRIWQSSSCKQWDYVGVRLWNLRACEAVAYGRFIHHYGLIVAGVGFVVEIGYNVLGRLRASVM